MKNRTFVGMLASIAIVTMLVVWVMEFEAIPRPEPQLTTVVVSNSPPAVPVTGEKQESESEGDRKLRELGFDPKRGHPITMTTKTNK